MRRDRGGIITGWLVRLAVVFGLLGVAAFEGGSIVVAKVQADGTAIKAAEAAGGTLFDCRGQSRCEALAESAAREVAEKEGAVLVGGLTVSADGTEVQITVEKRAKTLIAHRISALRKYVAPTATHEAPVR